MKEGRGDPYADQERLDRGVLNKGKTLQGRTRSGRTQNTIQQDLAVAKEENNSQAPYPWWKGKNRGPALKSHPSVI